MCNALNCVEMMQAEENVRRGVGAMHFTSALDFSRLNNFQFSPGTNSERIHPGTKSSALRDHKNFLILVPETKQSLLCAIIKLPCSLLLKQKTYFAMCDHNIALLLAPETKLVLLLKTPPSAKSTVH